MSVMGEKRSMMSASDKEKRDYNKRSLFNLKQFQKPVPNANPSVNQVVNSGVNWAKLGKIAIIAIVISAVFWKLYQRKKRSEDTKQD